MGLAGQSGGKKQSRKKEQVGLDVGQIWVCYRSRKKVSVSGAAEQGTVAQYDAGEEGRNKIMQSLKNQIKNFKFYFSYNRKLLKGF